MRLSTSTAMAADEKTANELDLIEARVKRLEEIVYGGNIPRNTVKIAKICEDAKAKFHSVIDSVPDGNKVWTEVGRLETYLSQEFFNNIECQAPVKAELVLTAKEKYMKLAENLDEVSRLKHAAAGDKLADALKKSDVIQPLVQINVQQQDEAAALSGEFYRLLSAYNDVMSIMSSQFVKWDNAITQCELAFGNSQVVEDEML